MTVPRWLLIVAMVAAFATALLLLVAGATFPRVCVSGGSAVGPIVYNAETGEYEGETEPVSDCYVRRP